MYGILSVLSKEEEGRTMSEKKNFQLKNEEPESKRLDADKLEDVSGGFVFYDENNSKSKERNIFILDSEKPDESKKSLTIKVVD